MCPPALLGLTLQNKHIFQHIKGIRKLLKTNLHWKIIKKLRIEPQDDNLASTKIKKNEKTHLI